MSSIVSIIFKRFALLTRTKEFDSESVQGRSDERHRRIILTSIASLTARVTTITSTLISTPLVLKYLGVERFGLWMTISSVVAMLSFADLGVGNGLLNAISKANGTGDQDAIHRYISSTLLVLSCIALVIIIPFLGIYTFINWANIFNVTSPIAINESGNAIAVFVLCFAINIPVGIVQKTQLGLQLGFISQIWQAIGSLFGLLSVFIAVFMHSSLPVLVAALAGAPIFIAMLNGIYFFFYSRPDLRPNIKLANRHDSAKVLNVGLLFLVLQIAASISFSADNIIIARMLGASAVAEYSVATKMFSVVSIVLGIVLLPLWPAYGEANAKGDREWIKRTVLRTVKLSILISSIGATLLLIFAKSILEFWVGNSVAPTYLLLFCLAVWCILEATGNSLVVFLNGVNVIRFQVILAIICAPIMILSKIYCVTIFGAKGIVIGGIISYMLFAIIPYSYYINRKLKEY